MNKRKTYIRHPRLTEKPLILYPAGEYGRNMLKELRRLAIEPVAFCDASEAKIGTVINGVAVQSLDSLLKRYGREGARYLINSAYNYPQIEARLTSYGVPLDCILAPDIYSYCDTGRIERPIQVSQEEQAQLKRCLLDLLCFFHKVCKKYGIPYYITSGTLLGAVRHKGFIPWDDDIDVAMLRKDYNRFYRVVQKELGDTYEIQEMPSRKNLGLKNSVLRLFASSQKMMIMIDTFPIDYVFPFPNRFNLLQERGSMFLFRLAQACRWYDGSSRFSKLGRFLRRLGEHRGHPPNDLKHLRYGGGAHTAADAALIINRYCHIAASFSHEYYNGNLPFLQQLSAVKGCGLTGRSHRFCNTFFIYFILHLCYAMGVM